ncbi:MAG TPA: hypothetical protein DEH78_16610 [Solibacterales bacterium]|nr:hypothetical protein [Bryobacterales bacterium]
MFLLAATAARAGLITDLSQVPFPRRVVDFSQFLGDGAVRTQGPQEVSLLTEIGVTFDSSLDGGSILFSGFYGLGVNGDWGGDFAFAGLDFDLFGFDAYSMWFTFTKPVNAFAAFMNYRVPTQEEIDGGLVYSDVILEAFGSRGGVIETHNLTLDAPISTPFATNAGAYRGIGRAAEDIYGFRVSNAGVVLTNLTLASNSFPTENPIPEPGTFALLGGALLLGAAARRRARGVLLTLALAAPAFSQFTSGSNGSDGALDLQVLPGQTTRTVEFDPDALNLNPARDNVFHFTTINIGPGVTVVMRANKVRNLPVIWLASGAVTIAGTINVSGAAGHPQTSDTALRAPAVPGPGGFAGGLGEGPGTPRTAGSGPGGGGVGCDPRWGGGGAHASAAGCSGPAYGNALLIPIRGGSGGAGAPISSGLIGAGGGAGGGAIRIVSSVSVAVTGSILADGGPGANNAGGGGGGAIHIVAPNITGGGILRANGGSATVWPGAIGRIRLDATTLNFAGTVSPAASTGPLFNPPLPSNVPTVRVVSIGGVNVPLSPNNSFTLPDVVINSTTAVPVLVQAANIPVGTVVTLNLTPEIGSLITANTSPLSGTLASSTGTAQVLFPTGVSRVFVGAKW